MNQRTTGPYFARIMLCGAILALGFASIALIDSRVSYAQSPASVESPVPVRYTDVRESAKISFQQDSTQTEEKYYLETMGTGVGWIDYDQDGLMDLFFVQSSATDIYKPSRPLRCALYHNNGDGTFTDVTEKAGVGGEGHYGQGVAVGDFDNDGYPDLYVTGYGRAILYHNNGNGTFTDVTGKAGVADEGGWSTSAGWFDYDKDGWLDLVVTNYIEWSPKNNIWCGERRPGYRSYCHPGNYKGQRIKLYHNNHDGTFTDVSDASGVGKPEAKGMGVVLADFNNDGWPDIAIANDSWPNFLFINKHNGTFEDVSLVSGIAASEDGRYEAGMGIDAADVDGDGWQDVYITHLDFELNRLYHNNRDGTFTDDTFNSRIGNKAVLLSGVAMKFLDYDNDGWNDILQLNGAMLDNVSLYHDEVSYKEPLLMYRNLGKGQFDKVSESLGADFMRPIAGRGLATADYDNDGDIDIVTNNRGAYPSLLRNDGGNANHWLTVLLIGTKSNRDGTGTSLKLISEGFSQVEQAKGGMSYMSASDPRIHFGLGKRTRIESLDITWPSGQIDHLKNVAIDQIIAVKEGTGIIPRQFPKGSESEMNFPRRKFLGSSLVVLGSRLLDALATPLPKWKCGLVLQAAPAAPSTSPVQFVDVAAEAGLNVPNVWGAADHKRYIIEAKGSGIAFFDYDHDGWLDIYLTNGTRLGANWPAGHAPTSHLYKNNRDGTFTDVTEKSGLARTGWQTGICVGDYDNDGWDDLFCCFWGHDILFHNNGDGTFTDVTHKSGLHDERVRWGAGCTFLDYDRDGHLDLFVCNYIQLDPAKMAAPGDPAACQWKGIPVMCGPRGLTGDTNVLYHNNGDGTFTDVSQKSGILKPGPRYSITAVASDFDNDGWPDIYVAVDSEPSILFRNNHDGTFTDVAVMAGCAYSENGHEQAGMGVAVGDYDCDGWFDIFKTNFADDTCNLYHNNGDGTFSDVTFASGIGINNQYVAWGCGFVDYDNDGWTDILQVNGHVYPEIGGHEIGQTFKNPRLVYKNMGNGQFKDVSSTMGPGITERFSSRGAAFGDYDNDGDIDALILNMNDLPSLLRNDGGNRQNWIKIKLLGTKCNRTAIGARVRVVTGNHAQMDEVRSGSSVMSQSDLRLHFGLGKVQTVDLIEVKWPTTQKIERFMHVKANQILTIREGSGIVELATSPTKSPK